MIAIDVADGGDLDAADFECRLGIHHSVPADANDAQLQFLGIGLVCLAECHVRPEQGTGRRGGSTQERTTISAKHG